MKPRYTKFFEKNNEIRFIIGKEKIQNFIVSDYFEGLNDENDAENIKGFLEIDDNSKGNLFVITGYVNGPSENQDEEMDNIKGIFKQEIKQELGGIFTLGTIISNGLDIPAVAVSDASPYGIFFNKKYFDKIKPYIYKLR
jgi:hypothetical protein